MIHTPPERARTPGRARQDAETKAPSLALVINRTIEEDDAESVYTLAPSLASASLEDYAKYKGRLKAHFKRRVSFTDLEKAVKAARTSRASSAVSSASKGTRDSGELPADAVKLCTAPGSAVLYYSESTGYLVQNTKECRVLLGAAIRFERYATGADPESPKAFIEAHVCQPDTETVVAVVNLSRQRARELNCWSNLEGKIIDLPGDEKDSLLLYKAISAHATRLVLARLLVNQTLVTSFGWYEHQGAYYNVRANGCIGVDSLAYDSLSPLAVRAPKGVLQRLPPEEEINLHDIDGGVFLALLTFWQEDDFLYFPLALLFGCARIMLPHIEEAGVLEWQLELFGRTQFQKTSVINLMFATFFGDYRHGSQTEITDSKLGDTGPGLVYKEARLRGVAYMDVDYRYKPGHPLYTKYMDRRLESLGKTRNKAGGGERGKRHGEGSETRPDGGGLLVRTGESNPHEYSIAQCDDESTDAGAVTFKFYGDSFKHKEARIARSKAIEEQRAELCGLGVLWTQWLASLTPDFTRAMYTECKRKADELIYECVKAGGYTQVHSRSANALIDMLVGCLFFLTFLEQRADEIQGAREIYSYIDSQFENFINDRLSAAHQLALDYQEQRGGATQKEGLARKIGDAVYQEITHYHAHFENEAGEMPGSADMPDGYSAEPYAGYQELEAGSNSYRAGGVLLGVITPGYMYISPKDLLPLLEKKIKNCPSKKDCYRALEEVDALVTEQDEKRKYYTVQLGRGGPRYLKVPTWLVYKEDEDEPGTEHQNTEHQNTEHQNTENN